MNIQALARPEILAMKAYQSARGTAGADGVLLNANEAPRSLIEGPGTQNLNRYPIPQPEELTSRLADIYQVRPEQLLITRGSDEGIDLLSRVFCRPGTDAIVECPPCFGMYRISATIQGAEIITVPRLSDRGLQIDFDSLCETISREQNIRLVFLTTPNNPTGEVISRENLGRVLAACDKHALLVLDEAYIEFCDSPSASSLLEEWPNLVILRTLSKAFGAAGLRCGTVIAKPEIIGLLKRVMAPYPLTAPAIDAALAVTSPLALEKQQSMLEEIQTGKNKLVEYLERCPWVDKIWPGEANFVLLRVDDAPALTQFCTDQGVRIRDFSSQPMLDQCVRMTIGSKEDMQVLVGALNNYGESA
jgi:histidinol-phosphate aminotransferase